MASVRYLGIVLGEVGDLAGLREAPELGRFVPLSEPLPVGARVDLEGVAHVVARVEEGLQPGCWLRGDGVAQRPMEEIPTVREIAPAVAPVAAAPAASITEAVVPPDVEAAAPEPGTPEPIAEPAKSGDEGGGGRGRKRKRGGKTVIGR